MFQATTDWAKGWCDADTRFQRASGMVSTGKAGTVWEHIERPTDLRLALKFKLPPSSKPQGTFPPQAVESTLSGQGTDRWWQLASYVNLSTSQLDARTNAPAPRSAGDSADSAPGNSNSADVDEKKQLGDRSLFETQSGAAGGIDPAA